MAICQSCGKEIAPGVKFCENCGVPVKVESTPPTAAQPAQGAYTPPVAAQPTQTYTPTTAALPAQGAYTPPAVAQPTQTYTPTAAAQLAQGAYTPPAAAQPTQTYTPPTAAQAAQGEYTPPAAAQPAQTYTPPAGTQPAYSTSGAGVARSGGGGAEKWILIGGIALVVIIAVVLGVVLLGGKGNNSSDPNLGVWTAVSAEMSGVSVDVSDLFSNGFSIELKAKGKCTFSVDGVSANGKWSLDGSEIHVEGGGVDCDGTLQNGRLVLENVMGTGVKLTFTKDGKTAAANIPGPVAGNVDTDEGCYVITSMSDSEIELSGEDLASFGMESCYIELLSDGTGEIYLFDIFELTWEPGTLTLYDESIPFTREGDVLAFTWDGSALEFTRTAVKPEVSVDGPEPSIELRPNPDTMHNTTWYGWIQYSNYWGRSDKKSVDTDTYDAWGYIGYSSSGDEYFEIYQDGSPDDPVVTMWVNGYEDHIEPIIDGDAWVLDAPIPEEEGYNFVLYPYDGGMSVWSYPYESPDGTWGCYVNFYMRIDGDEWDEMWDTLPPRYEEYKAALAG